MFHTFIIAAVILFGDWYYYMTYTNRLVTKFFNFFIQQNEKMLIKKTKLSGEKYEDEELDLYVSIPRENNAGTLLNVNVDCNDKNSKVKYNSAEMMTLLWYGNGNLVKIGRCFNKDFTLLLILSIISDLNRIGKIEICHYGPYEGKGVLLCVDDKETGIPYYDFCLELFNNNKSIPLHVFTNMATIRGSKLRNMVIEDLEKKNLAEKEVKKYLFDKIILNFWSIHMPLECQNWFRDYVFKDCTTDYSIKNLINIMIIASEVLYQKNRLFKNIFGENEIFYVKKKFTEGTLCPSICVTGDGTITKDLNKKKASDETTEITVGC